MSQQESTAGETAIIADRLRAALDSRDPAAFAVLLDEHVRWGGEEETPETCHTRAEVLERLSARIAAGVETHVTEVLPTDDAILLGLSVKRPVDDSHSRERSVYQVLKIRNQRVVDIRPYGSRSEAARMVGIRDDEELHAMQAREVVPILNITNLSDSFAWFHKLGWHKLWEWSGPDGVAGFGAIASGDQHIFLSLNAQGGRGRGSEGGGMWLSVWVDDVDMVHDVCVREGLEVLRPPQNEPWRVREMQVRHPDGHVLRISSEIHSH